MRKFKKIFLFGIFALALCFTGLLSSNNNTTYNTQQTHAADAENPLFNYVTLSKNNQVLDTSNLKVIDNSTYVVGNGTTTITMQPFKYNYFIADTSNFIPTTKNIEIVKDENGYSNHFKLNEDDTVEYYYNVAELTGELKIYTHAPSVTSVPIVSTSKTNVLSYYEDVANEKFIITYVVSYTLSASAPDGTIFTFNTSSSSSALKTFSIGFLKPVVKFANSQEPIVKFTCNGVDAGPNEYIDTTIAREHTYNSVNIEFLNNSYSEKNPLYFDINYNGFIYTFELFSKEYNTENLLFVNYKDETTPRNNLYLATALDPDADYLVPDEDQKIAAKIGTDDNLFSLLFNRTGRYQIDIYDSTYLTGMQSANFYSTSFYIDDQTVSAFENIYIISQTLDNDNKEIEYIVSKSTLNNSVKTTIKNIYPENVESIIDHIEVQYTTFGGSNNIPTITNYSSSQIKSMLDENNNLIFTFLEDAYYQIKIYQKQTPGQVANIIDYEFTVVKHAKTTFTIPFMDEDGEPYVDENGKKAETHTASKPFHTEIINYHKYIPKTMDLSVRFKSTIDPNPPATPIKKTFINNYTISYGMERVSIEQFKRVAEKDEKIGDEINLRFYGVGTLTVQIKINGKTLSYKLNSEKGKNTIRLTEYGTYEVRLVDSMGTQTSQSYTLKKQLNISAIVLIILSVLLIAIISIFILRARGKLATR